MRCGDEMDARSASPRGLGKRCKQRDEMAVIDRQKETAAVHSVVESWTNEK
jgi:hypothetical protein